MVKESRDRWSSRTIFLLAAIGSAVGLGNIWRFPYLTYEYGGGAFLIPYLIALFVIGIPLLILEFAVGQKFQKGAVAAFGAINKRFKGFGVLAIVTGFMVIAYYAAVMAWALVYLINSFSNSLPWAGNAESFFLGDVLQITDGISNIGGMNWPLFAGLLAIWVLIYFCVWKGVKSVGKVVAWTMPLPLILLAILFVRGITLDGALAGISVYLTPDFSALLNTEIWLAAASQIFFTLTLGFGVMLAYASYNKENQNITSNAFITAISNSAISIFCGFVVFSVLGFMATTTGVAVADVAASGPGLAFVVFPEALSLMPLASFFAVIFFIVLLTLGIDSAFSLVEAVNAAISDSYKKASTAKIALMVCAASFLAGLVFVTNAGLYFLDVIDHFLTNFSLIIAGISLSMVAGWGYGAKKIRDYINSTSTFKLGAWWDVAIKYVIPVVLTILIIVQFIKEIQEPYGGYPSWALAIGWGVVVVPLLIAFGMMFKKK